MHISDKDDLIRFIDKNNVNFSLHWSMEAGTTMIYSITLREFTSPNLQHPNGVEQEYNEAYVERLELEAEEEWDEFIRDSGR